MDCTGVNERIAAYLDGQLAPAETEHVDDHLEGCPNCVALVEAMAGQDFAPLSTAEKNKICGASDFWKAMDTSLAPALEQMAPVCAVTQRWTKRRVDLPLPMLLAYAAALSMAVVWGTRHKVRADDAVRSVEELGQELEQEQRLAAEPQVVPRPQHYRLVTHTPERGTF